MTRFIGKPPCSLLGVETGGDNKVAEFSDKLSPHTDWSRATRKKMALLKVANDPN